jgi:hypothetical protein
MMATMVTAVMTATAIAAAALLFTAARFLFAAAGLLFAAGLLLFAAATAVMAAERTTTGVTAAKGTTTVVMAAERPAAAATVVTGLSLAFHANQDRGHRRQSQRQTNNISLHQMNLQTRTRNGTVNLVFHYGY